MQYNNIRVYPFDNEEYEDEERELNERIRVSSVWRVR
jgi:septin 3/9/12